MPYLVVARGEPLRYRIVTGIRVQLAVVELYKKGYRRPRRHYRHARLRLTRHLGPLAGASC
jgi:hypothetical protein